MHSIGADKGNQEALGFSILNQKIMLNDLTCLHSIHKQGEIKDSFTIRQLEEDPLLELILY